MQELKTMIQKYGKASHKEALESAKRLTSHLTRDIKISCFACSILACPPSLATAKVDLVITDLPYGKLSQWEGEASTNHAQIFLGNIKPLLTAKSVVAICYNKTQTVTHGGYNRLKSFSVGKRRILILETT